jgi:hypothetical protein
MNLLSEPHSNAKTAKNSIHQDYLSYILYLAPAEVARAGINLCPGSSPACRAACLYTAGRGRFNSVQQARIRRTLLMIDHPELFEEQLHEDLDRVYRRAEGQGRVGAVRLNGTSDIDWVKSGIIPGHPALEFYDYTKVFNRFRSSPGNYHLTLSASGTNDRVCKLALARGYNVAVVFRGEFPAEWWGYPVVSGDTHDLRFLDPRGGYVIALSAKGAARRDRSGFVRDVWQESGTQGVG